MSLWLRRAESPGVLEVRLGGVRDPEHEGWGRAGASRPESGLGDEAELFEDGDAVVEADLFGDEAFSTFRTVVPVNSIFLPVPAGSVPRGMSSKASPVWLPPPFHWPTT